MDLMSNVIARCAGLVEIDPPRSERYGNTSQDPTPSTMSMPLKALSDLDMTMVRFVHRSAQEFLLETDMDNGPLLSCGLSDDYAGKRLLLASAIVFVLKTGDTHVDRILSYAQCLDMQCWTADETRIVDIVFRILLPRGPTNYNFDVWADLDFIEELPEFQQILNNLKLTRH